MRASRLETSTSFRFNSRARADAYVNNSHIHTSIFIRLHGLQLHTFCNLEVGYKLTAAQLNHLESRGLFEERLPHCPSTLGKITPSLATTQKELGTCLKDIPLVAHLLAAST